MSARRNRQGGAGKAAAAVIAVALLASGCASNPQAEAVPPPPVDGFALAGVDVTVGEDAWTGRFGRLDDIDDAEFAGRVEEHLRAAVAEAASGAFAGERRARIVVHVDEMNIASGVGKTFLFKRSRLGGIVSVIDAHTDEPIAEARLREVEALRAPLQSDANLSVSVTPGESASVGGAWVELAGHLAEDRVEHIARAFAERVRRWLDSGRAAPSPAVGDAAGDAPITDTD